jgi:hypothetical protein
VLGVHEQAPQYSATFIHSSQFFLAFPKFPLIWTLVVAPRNAHASKDGALSVMTTLATGADPNTNCAETELFIFLAVLLSSRRCGHSSASKRHDSTMQAGVHTLSVACAKVHLGAHLSRATERSNPQRTDVGSSIATFTEKLDNSVPTPVTERSSWLSPLTNCV